MFIQLESLRGSMQSMKLFNNSLITKSMFFILSKLFYYFLLNPIFWILGLIAYSRYTKNVKRQKRVIWSVFILIAISTNPWLTNTLVDWWEPDLKPMSDITTPYEVGIVLGGFSEKGMISDRLRFGNHPNRMTQAIELYQVGKIKKILVTGCTGDIFDDGYCEATVIKTYLIRLGIPSIDILTEDKAMNTRQNALYTKEVLLARDSVLQNSSYLLLTSAFHLPRSIACFKKVGLDIDAFPLDSIHLKSHSFIDNIIPQLDAMKIWVTIIKEWFGLLSYKMAGYV